MRGEQRGNYLWQASFIDRRGTISHIYGPPSYHRRRISFSEWYANCCCCHFSSEQRPCHIHWARQVIINNRKHTGTTLQKFEDYAVAYGYNNQVDLSQNIHCNKISCFIGTVSGLFVCLQLYWVSYTWRGGVIITGDSLFQFRLYQFFSNFYRLCAYVWKVYAVFYHL